MNADESIKKYDITVMDSLTEGTTTEHRICATHVEIVDGNLCFYDGAIGGRIFKQRKLVAAYAAGIWTSFEQYEDEDEAEWLPQEEMDVDPWQKAADEAIKNLRRMARHINPGKDGSIAGD